MSELSKREIEEIRDHFDFFDKDKSGLLDEKEFVQMFKVIAPSASTSMAKRGFQTIDKDNNDLLDFEEFLEWWKTNWTVF